jgi:hypothetical protein
MCCRNSSGSLAERFERQAKKLELQNHPAESQLS